MNRAHQALLIASTLLLSWLGMQAVHELGHVIAAWCTGGDVARVVLHPLTISRTDLAGNPRPLLVAWAGPCLGVVLPLVLFEVFRRVSNDCDYLLRFFAGFCLVANGAYIGLGSFSRVGDAGDLLRYGSPIWQLWLFGVLTFLTGLRCWHGQGQHFGLGETPGKINKRAAYVCTALTIVVMILELLGGGR